MEEAPQYVTQSITGANINIVEQTNYNLESLNPQGVIRNASDKNSPLENALLKVYGDKEVAYNWIQANIEKLNLKNKSPKEKYKALVNEFFACEKAFYSLNYMRCKITCFLTQRFFYDQ